MKKQEMIELLTGVRSSKQNYYTELKTTVEELKKRNSQLELMNEVMRSFNMNMSVQEMLEKTLKRLGDIYPIKRVSLALFDGKELRLSYVSPEEALYLKKETPFPHKNSLYYEVFATGQERIYQKGDTCEFFEKKAFQQLSLQSVFLFPLTSRGKIIGVLSLGGFSPFSYDANDQAFLLHLAGQIAVCVENARLYEEVFAGKQQWEETFRAVSDAILIISPNGTVLSKNDAAVSAWPLEDFEDIRPFIQEASRSANNPFEETVKSHKPHYAELRFQNKFYDCSCYPLFGEEAALHAVILYSKDVTEKRQMEAQLLHSGQLAAIGEMAAGVAHELNNPLTAIIGNTQLLLRRNDINEQIKPLLDDIDLCGKRCRTIIRSLLAFSRQEEFAFKPCSLNQAVTEALSLTRRQIEKQNIQLDIRLADSLPLINGNLQQLSQIAVNLLINAKDALEEVTDRKRKLIIETATDQQSAFLKVIDNGSGIDAAIANEIFHPFFTTKAASSGTGLGLPVSFGIAKSHGGRLFAESIQPHRTIFTLSIPLLNERL
ncbi:histidine kinase dimerization/phospho-acceptor domain-containing protein [Pseudobacillus badius]|uniref:sensor histidine kinase n=1 Tax=Bacillus badius TaxID=1455 RepID=UPI003CEBBD3E